MIGKLLLSALIAIALLATPMASVAGNAKGSSFAKVVMPKGDKTGAIMFEAPLVPGDYLLLLSPLTEDGATKNAETFNIRQKKAVFTSGSTMLQLRAARPGTYVVRMMTTQT
jgi:hypothetical protein